MTTWVVRAGSAKQYLEAFLQQNIVGLGWNDLSPETDWSSKSAIASALEHAYPNQKAGTINSWASQIYRFATELSIGDFVLTPGHDGKEVFVGEVASDLRVMPDGSAVLLARDVVWRASPITTTSLADDLRRTLGSIMTLFTPRVTGAQHRLEAILDGNADPGPEESPSELSRAWIFQANPDRYDLLAALEKASDDHWAANQNRQWIRPGDRVWFRITGKGDGSGAGIYAVGRVLSEPEHESGEFGNWQIEVAYEARIDPPILKPESDEDDLLSKCSSLTGLMGTNLRLTIEEDGRLEELAAERMIPVAGVNAESRMVELRLRTDVDVLRQQVEQDLLETIRALGHIEFEHVCGAYLEALGCDQVIVVGAATSKGLGDGGIDVTGVLSQPGLPPIPLKAQAKNQQAGVGPSVVTQMRGSIGPGTHGLVITTSHFTKAAREEAEKPGLTAIHLVDGAELVRVLVRNGIGASEERLSIYRLDVAGMMSRIGVSGSSDS